MSAVVLNGKELAKRLENSLADQVQQVVKTTGKKPKLVTILVGDFAPSVVYVNMKKRACERVGMECQVLTFRQDITTQQLVENIQKLNNDGTVNGILIQHPLPNHIDWQLCFDTVAPSKDVDGLSSFSFGKMCNGQPAFVAATAKGIITLLKEYNIPLEGKHAVVVGRSVIIGKPIAMQLLNANATVTICHSKTTNLKNQLKSADIVVAALGKPEYIKTNWLKKGVVIIDAGYNPGNIGDVQLQSAHQIASAYTPVPGGVGPMTIISLLQQTLTSFKLSHSLE